MVVFPVIQNKVDISVCRLLSIQSHASADVKFEANERARPEGVQVVWQGTRKKPSHQNAEGKYHEKCMGRNVQTDRLCTIGAKIL